MNWQNHFTLQNVSWETNQTLPCKNLLFKDANRQKPQKMVS